MPTDHLDIVTARQRSTDAFFTAVLKRSLMSVCACMTVITGTVITAVMRGGSMYATVSIINVYKEGSLAIQQAGKTMSTKIVILCAKCPLIRRGEAH